MKIFTHFKLLKNVHWIIEVMVQLVGEIYELFVRSMLEMQRSFYSNKRRAKRMEVCHKCVKWTCDKRYRSKRMILKN